MPLRTEIHGMDLNAELLDIDVADAQTPGGSFSHGPHCVEGTRNRGSRKPRPVPAKHRMTRLLRRVAEIVTRLWRIPLRASRRGRDRDGDRGILLKSLRRPVATNLVP
jgi:hypothetical protein